jgi:glucuronate isomerase
MNRPLRLDPERFFPAEPHVRRIAVQLFSAVERLPIVSPHGHTDPAWFASDAPFEDAVSLLLWPDHYLLRMLMSVGLTPESLGIRPSDGVPVEQDRRVIWRRFAEQYHVFRATPSRLWLDHVFSNVLAAYRL